MTIVIVGCLSNARSHSHISMRTLSLKSARQCSKTMALSVVAVNVSRIQQLYRFYRLSAKLLCGPTRKIQDWLMQSSQMLCGVFSLFWQEGSLYLWPPSRNSIWYHYTGSNKHNFQHKREMEITLFIHGKMQIYWISSPNYWCEFVEPFIFWLVMKTVLQINSDTKNDYRDWFDGTLVRWPFFGK